MTDARTILDQLRSYTIDIAKFLGIAAQGKRTNNYGPFAEGMPNGAITHYTASNNAVTIKNPYGRIPVLLTRFMPGGAQGVGVHFIVWDRLEDRFNEIRSKYPALSCLPTEVFFFGDKLTFWHAGWANSWAYGIEIRNCGQLLKSGDNFFWGKNKYIGRTPIEINHKYWEPYTKGQMIATLMIHRWMCSLNKIRPERFLGHMHVTSTRIDPGDHFPLEAMRQYTLFKPDISIDRIPFLRDFKDDPIMTEKVTDPLVAESKIHEGKYRDDRDGSYDDSNFEAWTNYKAEGSKSSEIRQAKFDLRLLGYYVSNLDQSITNDFVDTVRIFQCRWKKKVGGKFVQELQPTGELNPGTLEKLKLMKHQFILT